MQFLLLRALEGRNETYTIARQKLTWVKTTLLKDFEKLTNMYEIPVHPRVKSGRQEQIYNVKGTEFAFFGLDEPAKLHGRQQDIFWLNEGMEIGKDDFDQLEMRTNKFGIIDYNPYDDEHWIFELHKRPDVAVIKSTILDNRENLPQAIVDKIMGYRPTPENYKNGTADPYMWQVYGLGNKARLQGAVFTNWDVVDSIPVDAKDLGLGLDFGFSNDPAALVEVYLYNKEIYLNELIYETGLLNVSPDDTRDTLVRRMKDLGITGGRTITADSSEPKSIVEIRNENFSIEGAVKGQDSVRYGIDLMKGYKIHLTRKSVNLEREFRKYKWREDKNGKSLNEPVDEFNHGIDAARYRITKVLGNNYETEISDTFL